MDMAKLMSRQSYSRQNIALQVTLVGMSSLSASALIAALVDSAHKIHKDIEWNSLASFLLSDAEKDDLDVSVVIHSSLCSSTRTTPGLTTSSNMPLSLFLDGREVKRNLSW